MDRTRQNLMGRPVYLRGPLRKSRPHNNDILHTFTLWMDPMDLMIRSAQSMKIIARVRGFTIQTRVSIPLARRRRARSVHRIQRRRSSPCMISCRRPQAMCPQKRRGTGEWSLNAA